MIESCMHCDRQDWGAIHKFQCAKFNVKEMSAELLVGAPWDDFLESMPGKHVALSVGLNLEDQ